MEERTFADQAAHIHYLEAELTLAQETVAQLREQVAELQKVHPGHVVLTKRGDTEELIAVTRQDDDGQILSIIWEKPEAPHAETPTEMMDDVAAWATRNHPTD